MSVDVLPGGKPAAANVALSTANDGGFDTCVQQAVSGQRFPDPHFDGPFPMHIRFHVGRIDKL